MKHLNSMLQYVSEGWQKISGYFLELWPSLKQSGEASAVVGTIVGALTTLAVGTP